MIESNSNIKEPERDVDNIIGNAFGNFLGSSFMISQSIYFMMPMFDGVFSFSKDITEKGGNLIFGVIEMFSPVGKMKMFKTLVSPEKSLRKSKIKRLLKKKGKLSDNILGRGVQKVGNFIKTGFIDNIESVVTSAKAIAIYIAALNLAIVLYNFFIQIILLAVITLFIIAKILFWMIDILKYRYITSFVVFWSITVNQNNGKIKEYLLRGVILLVAKPILIILSFLLFILSYELLTSLYWMVVNFFNYMLETSYNVGEESFLPRLLLNTYSSIGEIFIHLFGVYLAYIILLDGDNWFLKQIGYSDSGDNSQSLKPLADKIDNKVGKV